MKFRSSKKFKVIYSLLGTTLLTTSVIGTSVALASCSNGYVADENNVSKINFNSYNLFYTLDGQFTIDEWKTQTKLVAAINKFLDQAAGANKDKIHCFIYSNPIIPTSENSNNGTIKFKINLQNGIKIDFEPNSKVSFDPQSSILTVTKLNIKNTNIPTINLNSSNLYDALNAKFNTVDWYEQNKLIASIDDVLDNAVGTNNKDKVSCSIEGVPVIPNGISSNIGTIKFKINVEPGIKINIMNSKDVLFDSWTNIVTISNLNLNSYVIPRTIAGMLNRTLGEFSKTIDKFETNEELYHNHSDIVQALNEALAIISPELQVRAFNVWGGWSSQLTITGYYCLKLGILFNQPYDLIDNQSTLFDFNKQWEVYVPSTIYITNIKCE